MMDKTYIRNHIIYQTAILFLNQGYTKTTTKQIAASCNITEGALFRTFKDKESIYKEILNNILLNNLIKLNNIKDYFKLSINCLYLSNTDDIINDLLINLYTLPNTKKLLNEYIAEFFNNNLNLNNHDIKEYYELEVALSGIFLNYLKLETNMYFNINQKINRYIEIIKILLNNIEYNVNINEIKEENNIFNKIKTYFLNKGGNN